MERLLLDGDDLGTSDVNSMPAGHQPTYETSLVVGGGYCMADSRLSL